jgi:predicted ribosomally synthesized peptide with SipW-like signal peptide
MNDQKNEKKSRTLFYSVITVAVIIIAVVGATYAYFTSNIQTDEGDVNVGSSAVTLTLNRNADTYSPVDLIPATNEVAMYAFANQDTIKYTCSKNGSDETVEVTEDEYENREDDTIDYDACNRQVNNRCTDDNGYNVCGYYHMTISNSYDIAQQIDAVKLTTETNTFTNLVFAIYVKNGESLVRVTDVTDVPTTTNATASTNAESTETSINLVDNTSSLVHPSLGKNGEVEYYLVMWIKETGEPQNEDDGSKNFSGTISITTTGGEKVTGTISALK